MRTIALTRSRIRLEWRSQQKIKSDARDTPSRPMGSLLDQWLTVIRIWGAGNDARLALAVNILSRSHQPDARAGMKFDRATYLEVSPYEADGGQKVGKLPGSVRLEQLRALGHPESPIRAIRSKCLDCSGGASSEIRKCVAVTCALWPLRMGSNPFHGKKEASTNLPTTQVASAPPGAEDAPEG
jgi:hypothetical protein